MKKAGKVDEKFMESAGKGGKEKVAKRKKQKKSQDDILVFSLKFESNIDPIYITRHFYYYYY